MVTNNIDQGHRGNSRLKKLGVQIDWTPDMVKEYLKCSKDPVYFAETYMKIVHVDRGLIPLKLFDYQKRMINLMAENRFVISAQSRQSGKTTTACAFILWYIIFNADKTVGMLANKGETAREILSRVKLAYQYLPKWMQHGIVDFNKGSFVLENNSKVIAASTSNDNVRGFSFSFILLDETAFIENWPDFSASVLPTISSGRDTRLVMVSTPNGLNHFHEIWENAIRGINDYKPILVRWDEVPGRDEEWRRATLATLNFDEQKFDQEYNVEFQGSSGTLISGWKLKQLEYVKPLVEAEGLATYFHPEKSHQYACIVDVSRGKGLDYSAFHIIDITMMPYRQVCTYRSNSTTPIDYAEIIYRVCKSYNSAHCLVELNDIGGQVADALFESFDYENILYTESAGRAGKRLTRELGKQVDRGVRTTKTLKSIGCSMLKLLVEQNQLEIIDKETISELKTFSKKNNSYEAEQGKHDDLVMGLVLFAWMSDQDMFKQMTDINTLQNLRDNDEEDIQNQLLPFGLWDGGAGNEVVIDSTEKREGWQLVELTDNEWNEIAYEDTSWTRGRF
jgi:hypothetical protein